MKRNALVCLAFLPLWSIPYSLSFFYLSLYFRECGVSDAQLGILVTAGAAASILFSFLAAPLVDCLGRKRSTLIFDLLGSVVPFAIYALDGRFAAALVGTVISNASRVMNVAYYLLMTEDSDNRERSAAFNAFNILYIASGLLVPLAGVFIRRSGIVPAERWFLGLSAAAMAIGALGRNIFAVETRAGRMIMEKTQLGAGGGRARRRAFPGFAEMLKPYGAATRFLRSDGRAAAVMAANVLFYVYYMVGTAGSFYFAPFFADALGMDSSLVGGVGAVFSGGTLLAMLFLNPPLLRRIGASKCAAVGAAVNLGGFLPLAFLPAGSPYAAILSVGLASLGYGMLKSAIDAALSTCFGEGGEGPGPSKGEEARSGVYSAANLLSSVLGMGAGALCGRFYSGFPRLIPILSALLLGGILAMLLPAERRSSQSSRSRRTS